ncbi:MAG: hypothetical protein HFJ10_07110, partial [Lachnospiraceae bacterium]|nr:hypothetical protein [Lachnospiraceae bacterium]
MWRIWKEELCKIASRKMIWLGVFLLLGFVTFRLFAERDDYTMTLDGKTYHGQEAIEKDQELTRMYAGPLTMEKLKQIYQEYGFYYYDTEQECGVGNFCNYYMTNHFTNYRQASGKNLDQIEFYQGQDWDFNAAPLLENEVQFDYVYGWNDFIEIYTMDMLVLFVILIIGVSPTFAEEYQLKTADILRTTPRGRQSGIWVKILAALFFGVTLTCLVCAYLWGIYLIVYGTQGLDASAVLLDYVTVHGYTPEHVPSLDKGIHGRKRVNFVTCGVTFNRRTSSTPLSSALQDAKFTSFRLF